ACAPYRPLRGSMPTSLEPASRFPIHPPSQRPLLGSELGMRLDRRGQVIVERLPADPAADRPIDGMHHRVAMPAEIVEGHQMVSGQYLARISRLAALDGPGTLRQGPIDGGIPQTGADVGIARSCVVDADELVDDAVAERKAEHEGDHVARLLLAQHD